MKYYKKEYIKKITNNIFINKKKPIKPKLKILIGPPASGKGTLTKKYRILNKQTIAINYDDIIHNNPKYIEEKKLIKNKDKLQELYYKYRSEIGIIDNILHEKILDKRYSILWETTGLNVDFMYNWFHDLKKKGYTIDLHLICIDIKCLYSRLKKRQLKIGQEPAPNKKIKEGYNIIYKNISKIFGYVNNLYIYENNKKPIKIITIKNYYNVKCLHKISDNIIILLKKILPKDIMKAIYYSNSCKIKE